jgi:hypothetical protein
MSLFGINLSRHLLHTTKQRTPDSYTDPHALALSGSKHQPRRWYETSPLPGLQPTRRRPRPKSAADLPVVPYSPNVLRQIVTWGFPACNIETLLGPAVFKIWKEKEEKNLAFFIPSVLFRPIYVAIGLLLFSLSFLQNTRERCLFPF